MATRHTPFAPGTPCWVDLLSSDPERAKQFYASVLGWGHVESGPEFGNYVTFDSGGHAVAGMVRNTPEMGGPDAWTTYLCAADAEATVAKAVDAGAQVFAPAMQVGDLGSMAVLCDPVGAVFGIWQPGTHTGFGKYNEPGSVTWDEHHSKDFAASSAFYTRVFGWTLSPVSDTDEFRYSNAKVEGEDVAGLMDSSSFLPAEVPSHWVVYFSVADVDQALARVTEHGGSVVRPAEDTPYGRVVDVADPSGANFRLHQVLPTADSSGSALSATGS